jgi:hypothetical protein
VISIFLILFDVWIVLLSSFIYLIYGSHLINWAQLIHHLNGLHFDVILFLSVSCNVFHVYDAYVCCGFNVYFSYIPMVALVSNLFEIRE